MRMIEALIILRLIRQQCHDSDEMLPSPSEMTGIQEFQDLSRSIVQAFLSSKNLAAVILI